MVGGGQTTNNIQLRRQRFSKEDFLWGKDIVEWKIKSRGLVWYLNRILLKGEGLNPKLYIKNVQCGRQLE